MKKPIDWIALYVLSVHTLIGVLLIAVLLGVFSRIQEAIYAQDQPPPVAVTDPNATATWSMTGILIYRDPNGALHTVTSARTYRVADTEPGGRNLVGAWIRIMREGDE